MQLVFTIFPAAIIAYMRTALWVIEEEVGRPAEVLLPMRVVAFGPVVDSRVANRAERRLVAIEHELVVSQHSLQVLQVVGEALFTHEGAHERASLGTEGQWVALLLELVQRLDLIDQVVRGEVVQLVGRLSIAEDYDERAIEEL